ncbi:hypothetical protein [Hydrogenimonas thermophila]|uniref:Uncharacterized protein n=1 Tax=Hydrogenimonas thermophila TaxID=223786 RepID=A0A1I5USY4_9BACT|nr:hypothetical protein [Hydrogenimonas thermophila]SFP98373.1 hypothetical protein SAMN05216234_1708 [Hydrogenimonas thermophila]
MKPVNYNPNKRLECIQVDGKIECDIKSVSEKHIMRENHLSGKQDFSLVTLIYLDYELREVKGKVNKVNKKAYLLDVVVLYRNKILCENLEQTNELMTVLKLFASKRLDTGDGNQYLRVVQKKVHGKDKKSLCCQFDKKRYIDITEAATMYHQFTMKTLGYSHPNSVYKNIDFYSLKSAKDLLT